jgi:polyisoprenoid-binding protein YceI
MTTTGGDEMTMTTSHTGGAMTGMPTGAWRIDPAHSTVGFSVRHLMSKVRGRFRDVDGRIVTGPSLADCRVAASLLATSVDTGVPQRDDDLRSVGFLDTEHHPDLSFTSRSVEEGADGALTVVGDLTIRGTTREVRLQAELLGVDETGLQGEPRIGFGARTTIRRSEFGVGERGAEGSKLVVGDAVTIEVEVEAVLDEDGGS